MRSKESLTTDFHAVVDKWNAAMKGARYDEALRHAAKALEIAIRAKQPALQKAASLYVDAAVNEGQLKSSDSKLRAVRCSFCARTRDEARLIVGADGQICEDCATNVFRFFTQDGGEKR